MFSALLLHNNNDYFLDRIMTCDEIWILFDNGRRLAQWLDRDKTPQHFPKPALHPRNVVLTAWWSLAGGIQQSYLNPVETITAKKYYQQTDKMHQELRCMCSRLVSMEVPILFYENPRLHVSQLTLLKWNELDYKTLPHPTYALDLLPTN